MRKNYFNTLGAVFIGMSSLFTTGCTPQNNEATSQAVIQKDEEKAKKQAEKEAEKQRKQQEKEKIQGESKEKKFNASIEKTVKKTIGIDDVESVEVNKNFDLPDPNNKVVLLNLKNANDKVLTWNGTTNILKKLAKEKEIQKVIFVWKAELTDTYGNKKSDPVMKMSIDRESLDKINFKNFDHNNIPNVVKDYWEHPAYNK
ncbi:hypothetical protein P4V72_26760 [Bacillus thuringiensis]|uniref:Uncharacterized protein n=1 Tax=Bacillus thuringiensis TaxID=1428 RepID=A0A9W3XIC8_BACTU|nr:hypothetical protein [Bacillus thuringiensis]AQY38488.1 hypothetical protein B4918_11010 [Bacillus thuringiensis]MDR4151027.1 hypothetical protein [Bacillus thuringiensis]MDR4151678.1 hypothetical protein [Bacillus thuringiensis]MEC3572132.1 hypothetical protein [Bacillus thuringiensis]MED2021807.1 hypothetical protein [Bacillus thuringiensis]